LAADGETHSSAPVAVRLVVVRRHAADRTATPVWAVDLIAHSEQVVQLEPDSAPDAHLRVWAYLLPDGRVAVDTELAWHGPLSVQSTSSGLQDNGVPAMVGITRHGDVEYEVYQTIVRLKDKVS
jgi:hypothetical protein